VESSVSRQKQRPSAWERRGAKPGPKPGQPHSGQFQPGFDKRRMGATVKRDFQALVREHADEALQCLMDCVQDEKASWKERRAASELIIAHAVGTPVSRVLQANVTGPQGRVDTAKLTNEELLTLALDASENASDDPAAPVTLEHSTEHESVEG